MHAAIDELGFVRNDAARQLRAGRSRSVGLVVLDVGDPFFANVARGAENRADEEGGQSSSATATRASTRERAYLDLFDEQRVTGVLITPAGDDLTGSATARRGGPDVLVDREPDGGLTSVAVDDVEGGRLAVEHLLGLGRRRIADVGGRSPSGRSSTGSRARVTPSRSGRGDARGHRDDRADGAARTCRG